LLSLRVIMDNELYVDLLLQSLPLLFDSFVVNFNMHKMKTSLHELVSMLKTAKSTIKKDKPVLLVGSSSKSKRNGKRKVPNKPNKKAKNNKGKNKEKVNSQSSHECYHCGKTGHWKRNCKEYLASLKSLLDLIYTDVCGPLNVSAKGNYYYFITFTDDYSRYGYVYLL
ncbi:Unknown protein, partial [Striga hermonthica]